MKINTQDGPSSDDKAWIWSIDEDILPYGGYDTLYDTSVSFDEGLESYCCRCHKLLNFYDGFKCIKCIKHRNKIYNINVCNVSLLDRLLKTYYLNEYITGV